LSDAKPILRTAKEKTPGTKPGVSFVGKADITFQRGTCCGEKLATWEDATISRRQRNVTMSGAASRRNAAGRMTAM
jgi:hypothetical protein